MANTDPASSVEAYCRDCGAEIKPNAEICPECGVRQASPPSEGDGIFDQYTTVQWVAAVIIGLLSFPIGLAIPAYFYIKSSNGTAREQGAWEAWAVILTGVLGIIAVELGGETGAKIILAVVFGGTLLLVLAAIVGSFVLGLGDATQVELVATYAVDTIAA